MSCRVHPSAAGGRGAAAAAAAGRERRAAVYTVWKRSSMGFQGTDGFCVYDGAGRLAFRLDNYSRRRKLRAGELLLMDAHGTPLLSLRPQLLSLHDRWNCYTATEEAIDKKQPPVSQQQQQLFTMRKCSALQSSDDAEVYMTTSASAGAADADASSGLSCRHQAAAPSFRVEGCFSRRSCKIRGSDGREAARISRKHAGVESGSGTGTVTTLGDDVFSLAVRPGVDAATVMAIVVVMDRICRRPYMPMVCSSQ